MSQASAFHKLMFQFMFSHLTSSRCVVRPNQASEFTLRAPIPRRSHGRHYIPAETPVHSVRFSDIGGE